MDRLQVEWRPIDEFYGYYEVSNIGTVRSLGRTITYKWKKYLPYSDVSTSNA